MPVTVIPTSIKLIVSVCLLAGMNVALGMATLAAPLITFMVNLLTAMGENTALL